MKWIYSWNFDKEFFFDTQVSSKLDLSGTETDESFKIWNGDRQILRKPVNRYTICQMRFMHIEVE